MQKIQIAYGFKTLAIGRLTIYTGKIRIKTPISFLQHKLQNYLEHITITEKLCSKHYKYYSTISFEITSKILNQQLIDAINSILCEMMHARIDAKYAKCFEMERVEDYLPL